MAMSTMLKISHFKHLTFFSKYWTESNIFAQNVRCFMGGPSKRVLKLMKKDGVPQDFDLIYRNPATQSIAIAQIFSLVTGIATASSLLFYSTTGEARVKEGFGPSSTKQMAGAAITLLSTCALLQYVCLKCPLRIYSDTKKFILIVNTPLGQAWKQKKVEFLAGKCLKVQPSGAMFQESRYKINGKTYLIFEHHFKSNADYHRMLGC